mgnify:CR=1 FL=1
MKKLLPVLTCLALTACGGGSDSSDTAPVKVEPQAKTERNVAAKLNGATIIASFDSAGAEYVIDGDNGESTYWSANETGDNFRIDFGEVVSLSAITIYTNDLSFSTANPSKIVEVSKDGTSWMSTSNIVGGDIPCLNSTTGSGKMFCEFAASEDIQFLRVTITAETNPELIKIYEINATGV